MSSHFAAKCRRFFSNCFSKPARIVVGFTSIFMLGCVAPEITRFGANPRLFCPGANVQVEWATKDVETISLTFNDVIITEENDGVEIIRNISESGVIKLIAMRPNWAAAIEQEIVLFTGHHAAEFTTTGCLGRGVPAGTLDVDTNGLPLIVINVSGGPLPLTVRHGGETHSHPAMSFNVWHRKTMPGAWSVTGMPQPDRSCRGMATPGVPPDPKSLAVLGSCSGESGDGPQSVTPPEAVPITAARLILLRCNQELSDSTTRVFNLWVREPTGCVVQEDYLANSYAEAAECAGSESKDVAGDVSELYPGPVAYRVGCGSPTTCHNFLAFTRGDARECALAWCPDSGSTFTVGRCSP